MMVELSEQGGKHKVMELWSCWVVRLSGIVQIGHGSLLLYDLAEKYILLWDVERYLQTERPSKR